MRRWLPLTAVVHLVVSNEAAEVLAAGPHHPVAGGLVDLGTVAPLVGLGPAGVRSLCTELGVMLTERDGPLAAEWRAEWELTAMSHATFVVITAEGRSGVAVAAGPTLPALGLAPPIDAGTFAGSLRFAMAQPAETSMFVEPGDGWAPEEDRRLDERLRQLYGG
jgi:hypothetical protein